MDPIVITLDERLANPGDTIPLVDHIAQSAYSLGDHEFSLPEGIDYDLMLTNVGEGILLTGIVRAHVVGTCDRCLEEAVFDISGEVDEYYLFEMPSKDEQADDEDDVDFSLVSEDDTVDVSDAISSSLLMETPYVVLCKPDCKGLCPTCGANLNEGECGCAAERERERAAASPFAALKDFHVDDAPQDEPPSES